MSEHSKSFQINAGIDEFCSRFSITEEEIARETLRKAYQRERKRRYTRAKMLYSKAL